MSRNRPAAGPTISLFPFLAVLLCTMGALLVVLVLFSRAVKEGVVADAPGAAAGDLQELESARDQLAWRLEQLEGIRRRTSEELARARMQLAGVEESSRALEDELAALERMATMLESGAAGSIDEAAVKELESRLASARESLDKARADQRTKPPAYAVVPYVGVNGTHRRPLYIECAGDGVFLQPENIRLGPADFQGPPGPGNPLASALRAAREHIVGGPGGTGDPAMQPYPLLIVRPSGVMAYYAAREAIQSWGSDFGYQLIDEDWTLSFPPADPTLVQVERRAVEESRQRLAWLAEVRPQRPTKQPRQYRAAQTRGGVVSDEGPSVLGDQSRWDWANGGADAGGGRAGRGDPLGNGRGTGAGDGSGPGSGDRYGEGNGSADGSADGRGGSRFATTGRGDAARGSFRQSVFSGGGAAGAGRGAGDAAEGFADPTSSVGPGGPAGAADGTSAAGGGPNRAAPGSGGVADQGRSGGAAGGSAAVGGLASVNAGDASTSGGQAGGSANGQSGQPGQAGAAAMPGLVQAGGGQSGAAGSSASATVSLAGARGKNWASLATQDRPIPLTRPIRLECGLHEFRIMDDSGRRVQTRIPLDGDTALAVDPLVKALHARVDTWGIAGDRMYWKPVLVLSETADGRSRREDLERLLADSGIDVRSADGRDDIRPLPPVERSTAAARR